MLNWMKLGAEYKQMPTFTAGGRENQVELWVPEQNLERLERKRFCSGSPAVMRVEIDRSPTTLPMRVPWVKSDRHFVVRSTGNRVPRPRNPPVCVCAFRFNKSCRAV